MIVTEETLIGDLVDQYPEVMETLMSYGVHCVGCQASPYEPIGDGFRSHGMTSEEITKALTNLNQIVSQRSSSNSVPEELELTLTKIALQKIKEVCEQKGKKALRITVKAGGCSGYKYSFELSDQQREGDVVIEESGAKVYVDPSSLGKMNGSIIDYQDSLQDAGFKINNPQAHSTCGCGNSFR